MSDTRDRAAKLAHVLWTHEGNGSGPEIWKAAQMRWACRVRRGTRRERCYWSEMGSFCSNSAIEAFNPSVASRGKGRWGRVRLH